MTSPYITFEEMEEGKDYIAFYKEDGNALHRNDQPYCRNGSELFYRRSKKSVTSTSALVFIPVYCPPHSWDEHLDAVGDFRIIKNNEGDYFSNRARILANDKELRAAIDWLQDELDRRKKAGES